MRSLAGLRVLVTRPPHQASELVEHLRSLGAETIELPLIEIRPAEDSSSIDEALKVEYDWMIFTSANAVAPIFERGVRVTARKIAAVGKATARALETHGVTVDCVPAEAVSDAILTSIGEVAGLRVLLPQGDIARKELAEGLRARHAIVSTVQVYRTVPAVNAAKDLEKILSAGVDVITFFSPSAVRAFVALRPDMPRTPSIVCVGPTTASAARENGFVADATAAESSAAGVVEAIARRMGVPA